MNPLEVFVSIGVTILCYAAGRMIHARFPSALTSPVVLTTAAAMLALSLTGVDYGEYRQCSACLVSLLGPATCALAVPLYRNRRLFLPYALPAVTGMVCGGFATYGAAIALANWFGLTPTVIHSIGIKSVTTPIAVELALESGGDPSLTAAFVVATGIIGATVGPFLLTRCGVRDPVARGLAFGTIAQGFGTVQALSESEVAGAVSGMAMGATAVCVSLWEPALSRFIG
jgi:putative effector of murein hydrolase